MFKTLSGLKDNAFWRAPHQITPHQLDVSSHSIRAGHGGNSLSFDYTQDRFGAGRFVRFCAISIACWRVIVSLLANKGVF